MPDFREKIQGFLSGLFKKKGSSVIGVDVGSSSVKIVQLRREKEKAILETYGELALGPYADRAVGQATLLSGEKLAGAVKDHPRSECLGKERRHRDSARLKFDIGHRASAGKRKTACDDGAD